MPIGLSDSRISPRRWPQSQDQQSFDAELVRPDGFDRPHRQVHKRVEDDLVCYGRSI
jgi:hypothetical protein